MVQCATVSGHPKAQVPCCTAARLRRVSHDVRASSSLRRSHAALACFQAPIHCHVCTLSPKPRKNALIRPFLGPFREYIHRADAEGPGFAVTSKLRDKYRIIIQSYQYIIRCRFDKTRMLGVQRLTQPVTRAPDFCQASDVSDVTVGPRHGRIQGRS